MTFQRNRTFFKYSYNKANVSLDQAGKGNLL